MTAMKLVALFALLMSMMLVMLVEGTTTLGSSLQGGQGLSYDQQLVSPNQQWRFIEQTDGNLVLYDKDGNPKWAVSGLGISYSPNSYVRLDAMSGNLIYYSPSGVELWHSVNKRPKKQNGASTSPIPPFNLTLGNDGNLILSGKDGPYWSTAYLAALDTLPTTKGKLHVVHHKTTKPPRKVTFVPHAKQMTLKNYTPVTYPLTDQTVLNHGRGPPLVTGTPKVYMILVGGWTAAETVKLDQFMAAFATSDYLRHLNWASGVAQSFAYQGYWSIPDATAIQAGVDGGPVLDPIMKLYAPTDLSAIYVILTNTDVGLGGCGFHAGIRINGRTPNLIWGNRDIICYNNPGRASLPTGDNSFDSMGSIVAHEMAELFTDPYPNVGNGVAVCSSSDGCSEVADVCGSVPLNTQTDVATGAYYNFDLGVAGKWELQDILGIVGYDSNNNNTSTNKTIVGCQAGATTKNTLLQGQYLTNGDILTSYNNLYKFTVVNRVLGVWKMNNNNNNNNMLVTNSNTAALAKNVCSKYWVALDPSGYLILYCGAFPNTNVTIWKSNKAPGAALGPYWASLTESGSLQLMNSYGVVWTTTTTTTTR